MFKDFRRAPGMCVWPLNFSTVVAFLNGCDFALGGRTLDGFREWLVGRIGRESGYAWPGLVLWFIEPVGFKPYSEVPAELEPVAIETLFRLLEEFIDSQPGSS
ncbi:hypothetical protein [Nonomuraea salmonea]|uniref:Barstar (barnase inhibitor) domain-containing protein n=1 Tax=Nonomuraea salmonea TaxID=46181 RepID=A0ABV5NQB7_9ACTN